MTSWQNIVRRGLKLKGIRYIDLANHFGVTEGAISHWINGHREPSFAQLKEISHMIDVPIHIILGETAIPSQIEAAQLIKDIPEESRESALKMLRALAKNHPSK